MSPRKNGRRRNRVVPNPASSFPLANTMTAYNRQLHIASGHRCIQFTFHITIGKLQPPECLVVGTIASLSVQA